MDFLNSELINQLKEEFKKFDKTVELLFFTQKENCDYCDDTEKLLLEVSNVTDKLSIKVYDINNNKDIAKEYNIDKTPAIVLKDSVKDYGIRFYGIPAGYEFASFLDTCKLISTGNTGLPEEIITKIKSIDKKVNFKVFVTPTCPYCPQAVVIAHRFAYLNDNVTSEMIEASEFMELSSKYRVQGVPRTVINDNWFIEGGVPVDIVLNKVFEAIKN